MSEEDYLGRLEAIATARNVAKRLGYAIAVHGSLVKDVDLVAVPWVEDAAPREELLEGIAQALGWIYGPPELRPHGRRGWALRPIAGSRMGRGQDAWYVDLSIMPRRRAPRE